VIWRIIKSGVDLVENEQKSVLAALPLTAKDFDDVEVF
jgi:hypothetical protein|tara:strand:- start:626 stop:739 length:114 start_codon:yes stop_codon:yes gene_type:complete